MSLLDDMDTATEIIAYRPERANESVEGVVVSRDITTSEYTDDDIPVLVIRTDDDVLRRVIAFHKVLRDEINRMDPQPGDRFATKYLGRVPNKKGTGSYHSHKVAVKRGSLLDNVATVSDDDRAPF